MINLPVEARIVPTEARLVGVTGEMVEDHANRWIVKYKEPDRVRIFLQARGLRNQSVDRDPLADALLAGLLPDIFGKVFENGARPQSGYSCHDGKIVDISHGDVSVVYTHTQFWDHYRTDPIRNGLSACGFSVRIESIGSLPIPVYTISREQLLKIIFGGRLQEVLDARPEFKGFDDLWQKDVFSYDNISKGKGFGCASLVMHPISPVYQDIEEAVKLYKTVVEVIRDSENRFGELADLSQQGKIAEGLLSKLREASSDFSIAFRGTKEGTEYKRQLVEVGNFVEGQREFLKEHVRSGQQRILTGLTTAFEPLRDRLVEYFTQPLFSTETN